MHAPRSQGTPISTAYSHSQGPDRRRFNITSTPQRKKSRNAAETSTGIDLFFFLLDELKKISIWQEMTRKIAIC